jgi:hypothetical protein
MISHGPIVSRQPRRLSVAAELNVFRITAPDIDGKPTAGAYLNTFK